MKRTIGKRYLRLEEIDRRAARDPEACVEEEDRRYFQQLESLARYLAVGLDSHCLVMLSGPSSSGKTTTALLLRDQLRELGVDAYVVSLDNFYRGRYLAPVLEDGSFDYEALEALDLEQLQRCMLELVRDGATMLPLYDFSMGAPAPERQELRIAHDSVVIFEGIHAINPLFERHLPQENFYKVFVNTISPIYDKEGKFLARRELRLIRRILRDDRFRASPVENTLDMWQQVVRGENLYMFPYVDTVDFLIDTTHAYEPCVFAGEVLPLLRSVASSHPQAAVAGRIAAALEQVAGIPTALVPPESLLREFLGDGLY